MYQDTITTLVSKPSTSSTQQCTTQNDDSEAKPTVAYVPNFAYMILKTNNFKITNNVFKTMFK